LGVVLSIYMACDGNGGVTIEPPVKQCGPDEILEDGNCQKKPPECRVDDGTCGVGRICLGLDGGLQPGAAGACVQGCIVGENTCASGWACEGTPGERGECKPKQEPPTPECYVDDSTCGVGRMCQGLDGGLQPGAPGECVQGCIVGKADACASPLVCEGAATGQRGTCKMPPPECTVAVSDCGPNRLCVGPNNSLQANTPGTCQEKCVYGNSNTCKNDWKCVGKPSIQTGELGVCKENPECVAVTGCKYTEAMECNEGVCVDKAKCRVGVSQESCDTSDGWACEGASTTVGTPGECKDKAECRVGAQGGCETADGWECKATATGTGTQGKCEDVAECRLQSATKGCGGNGWECKALTSGSTTTDAPGECKDVAECRVGTKACQSGVCIAASLETDAAGECKTETAGALCEVANPICLKGQVCAENPANPSQNICRHGELVSGAVVAVISEVNLSIGGQQVSASTGWVGPGAATLHVRTRGPAANTNLSVRTTVAETCNPVAGKCEAEDCTWSCSLPAGWAGVGLTGTSTAVTVSIGTGTEQVLTYRRSVEKPTFRIEPKPAVLGEVLEVCVTATATNASVAELEAVFELNVGGSIVGTWTPGTPSNLAANVQQQCWTTTLPVTNAAIALTAQADAEDTLGNVGTATYDSASKPLTLTRISSCQANVAAAVSAPLAFSNGRLVFGAGDSLYFLDTQTCAAPVRLQTGTVQGPMVVLGNDIALALGREGLAMVNASMQGAPVMHCLPGTASHEGAVFDKGLSVAGIGNGVGHSHWRLATPANAYVQNKAVLLAYTPNEEGLRRCVGTTALDATVALTPAQNSDASVFALHGTALSTWKLPQTNPWTEEAWSVSDTGIKGTLAGIALDNTIPSLWLSANAPVTPASVPAPAVFQLWGVGDATPEVPDLENTRTFGISPAAIDGQGNAYVVVSINGLAGFTGYELLRLDAVGEVKARHRLAAGTGNVAGSPILGKPVAGGQAEVYVVSAGTANNQSGKVIAFAANASTGAAPLWTVELGFPVSQTAQPVLAGNTLWVVGTNGQVRGIRVSSNGLSDTAQWPKAFRDNCNTSSKLVTPSNYSSCF